MTLGQKLLEMYGPEAKEFNTAVVAFTQQDDTLMGLPSDSHCGCAIFEIVRAAVFLDYLLDPVAKDGLWESVKQGADVIYYG